MNETDAHPVSKLETELRLVATRIEEAAGQVQRDEQIDLSSLNQAVNKLCNGLLKLSSTDAHRLAEQLPDIIRNLDELVANLKAQKLEKARPDSHVSHQRAAQAYDARQTRAPGSG
ncbi:MAG: hypothetical protein CMM47_09955 [Rhodospirillaceae bacterium]|nr:hypothetical protein [Rhodospirillaceae bacterium]